MSKLIAEDSVDRAVGRAGFGVSQLERRPSHWGIGKFEIKIFADSRLVTTDPNRYFYFSILDETLVGTQLQVAEAYVSSLSSAGDVVTQIYNVTQAVLLAEITIDEGHPTSLTSAAPSVPDLSISMALADFIAVITTDEGADAKGLGTYLGFW